MRKAPKLTILTGIGLTAIAMGGFFGCVHSSGGAWMIRSADTPEGWPDLTPVGEVQIREYPLYRAATVRDADIAGDGMNSMFMELFGHISRNDIAMTAPVDMSYATASDGGARMASMAFLYETTELGQTGEDGPVRVEDLEPQTFASVGVRGDYTDERFRLALDLVESWLASQAEWSPAGPPRYLAYNSPFVPPFLRYGEVQIPIAPAR